MPKLLKEVDDFIELVKDKDTIEYLELKVGSFALKKSLASEIYQRYKHIDRIYTNYKKGSEIFVVKKQKRREIPAPRGDKPVLGEGGLK